MTSSQLCLPLLVALVVILTQPESGESAKCPTQVTTYYRCSYLARVYSRSPYYYRCGRWWRRRRCTGYRQTSRTVTAWRSCSRRTTVYVCCAGWSGANCGVHNRSPIMSYCTPSMTARTQTIDSPAQVTWNPPRFTEPYNYPLTIQSQYPGNHASLPIGTNVIRYTATSSNNNRQVSCTFTVTVIPPLPVPTVERYSNLDEIRTEEGQNVTLKCVLKAADTAIDLAWYFGGESFTEGTSFTSSFGTTLPGFWDSQNELTFTAFRDMDHGSLECKGQGLGAMTDFTLTLSVDYEVKPHVQHCPIDQTIQTGEGGATVSWTAPVFVEPNGETLQVTRNIEGDLLEMDLPMGVHRVRYTATNVRNKKTAVCEFTIDIQPIPCTDPTTPTNGAAVCGYWPKSYARICSLMCNEVWDVPQFSEVYKSHICDISGTWIPPLTTVHCSDGTGFPGSGLKSPEQYYPGNCGEQATKAHQETSFFNLVTQSTLNALVLIEGNNDVNMTIVC